MTIRQQWTLVLAIVLVLGLTLFMATRILGTELFPVTVGATAPDFRARTLEAPVRERTLADYKGKVVLLNIWATWCGPCRIEMPSIERLHRDFGPRGLHVVAVSIDNPGMEKTVRAFADSLGLTFEILHDPSGDIQQLYQTTGVPETFVIGSDGTIRKKIIGADNWSSTSNRAVIASLLGVGAGARVPSPVDSTRGIEVPAR
jgi:cytochrome c biogenesis protein CcmG/thiol:disulfide interchange protein DsbE